MTDEDRMKFDTDELYVKSPEEMSDATLKMYQMRLKIR